MGLKDTRGTRAPAEGELVARIRVVLLRRSELQTRTSTCSDQRGDAVTPINSDQNPLKTIILPEENWASMLTKVRDEILAQKMPGIMQFFFHQHYQQHNRAPTNDDWLRFLNENFSPGD